MTTDHVSLFEFMPYGAPELKEVSRKYMFRAVVVAAIGWIVLFALSFGTGELLKRAPKETKVVVVPYRELAAPPPLTENEPPPQVAVTMPVAPPTVGVAVPVPDAEAPPEQTIASQEEIAASTPGVASGGDDIVVAPPSEDANPKYDEFVYTDEVPVLISQVQPVYPDIARDAGVEGNVLVQVMVGKDGRVKETRIVKSIPMLDAAALAAVKQFVFKPALANNKPVVTWVAIPIRFRMQ